MTLHSEHPHLVVLQEQMGLRKSPAQLRIISDLSLAPLDGHQQLCGDMRCMLCWQQVKSHAVLRRSQQHRLEVKVSTCNSLPGPPKFLWKDAPSKMPYLRQHLSCHQCCSVSNSQHHLLMPVTLHGTHNTQSAQRHEQMTHIHYCVVHSACNAHAMTTHWQVTNVHMTNMQLVRLSSRNIGPTTGPELRFMTLPLEEAGSNENFRV
jgi:hypothetical protein